MPFKTGNPADKESVQADAENLTQGLGTIEKGFLKNNDFLCGNEISFADIMAVCEVTVVTYLL